MRVTKKINISNIYFGKKTLPINKETYDLAKDIEKRGQLKPIKTQLLPNGQHKLKDGRHRFIAMKLLNKRRINCRFYKKLDN